MDESTDFIIILFIEIPTLVTFEYSYSYSANIAILKNNMVDTAFVCVFYSLTLA
ncbi:MAG: hypothetical protein LBR10_15690 [Prevotellaceae bacterium]|nr:hypothetical protein [Prevotellaceae bacterium]